MGNKISKSSTFGLRIEKDPDEIESKRVHVSFSQPLWKQYKQFKMLVSFGYDGVDKTYMRSLFLDLKETVQLIRYLNECVYDEFSLLDRELVKIERIEKETKRKQITIAINKSIKKHRE